MERDNWFDSSCRSWTTFLGSAGRFASLASKGNSRTTIFTPIRPPIGDNDCRVEAIHANGLTTSPGCKNFEERYCISKSELHADDFNRNRAQKSGKAQRQTRWKPQCRFVNRRYGQVSKCCFTEDLLKGLSLNDLRFIRNEFWRGAGANLRRPDFWQSSRGAIGINRSPTRRRLNSIRLSSKTLNLSKAWKLACAKKFQMNR